MQRYANRKKLAETHPEIAAQWHPSKNGDLTPYEVTPSANRKVWWKCPIESDHEWEASVDKRTRYSRGCPYCVGQRATTSNCLATTHPHLLKAWDYENNALTPYEVTAGSKKIAHWKCPEADDHRWSTAIKNVTKFDYLPCNCCSGKKVVNSNCLATLNPTLSAEWHPTKNSPLTPYDVTCYCGQKVWWKCPVADDHEWQATLLNRSYGRGCPCCVGKKVVRSNCLAKVCPELCSEWDYERNDILPSEVSPGSHRKVWWICKKTKSHSWCAEVKSRVAGFGCPYCCESKGEKAVELFLKARNIDYKRQFKQPGCVHINPLFFDFAVFVKNELYCLVEYQGEQHYKPMRFNTSTECDFKLVKLRDDIKRNYCLANGIRLVEICYLDFDSIQTILESILPNHDGQDVAISVNKSLLPLIPHISSPL